MATPSGDGVAQRKSREAEWLRTTNLYFFLFFLSSAAIIPYLNLEFRHAGLSEAQVGVIAAFRPWIAAIASYGWAALADRFAMHRTLYIWSFIFCVLSRSLVAMPFFVAAENPFWAIFCAMLISDGLYSPCIVLADAAVVESLADSSLYGRIRMWGTAGWGFMAAGGGWIISTYGVWTAWLIHWVTSAACLAAAAFGLPFRKPPPKIKDSTEGTAGDTTEPLLSNQMLQARGYDSTRRAEQGHPQAEENTPWIIQHHNIPAPASATLYETLRRPKVFLFLLGVGVMGSGFGVIDSYLFLYLEELHASTAVMGATLTFTSFAEAPVFFFSDTILAYLGVEGAMHLVILAFVARIMAYTFLAHWPTPWLVLPVELLHGLTFGLAWAAGTHKSAELAPDGLLASMQGMFSAMYLGVGRGLGALIGGVLYNCYGAVVMFRCMAAFIAAGWGVLTLLRTMLVRWAGAQPLGSLHHAMSF